MLNPYIVLTLVAWVQWITKRYATLREVELDWRQRGNIMISRMAANGVTR